MLLLLLQPGPGPIVLSDDQSLMDKSGQPKDLR